MESRGAPHEPQSPVSKAADQHSEDLTRRGPEGSANLESQTIFIRNGLRHLLANGAPQGAGALGSGPGGPFWAPRFFFYFRASAPAADPADFVKFSKKT